MKIKNILGLAVAVLLFSQEVKCSDSCNCTSYYKKVARVIDSNENKFIVCGNITDSIESKSYLISEIHITDCEIGQLLLATENDEITKFLVTIFNDSITFSKNQYIPIDSNWNIKSVPLTEWTVKFINDSLIVSDARYVFEHPELSEIQLKEISEICNLIESKVNSGNKDFSPLDELAIYKLAVGAFHNHDNSKSLFNSLEKNFVLEGAMFETYHEIDLPKMLLGLKH